MSDGARGSTELQSDPDLGNADTLTARVGKREGREAQVFVPGEQVGRHTVMARLGAGGFGQVFLAFDENLKRKVALKVLYGTTDEQQKQRFRREGEALAALAHPNVVAVYDVVDHQGAVVLAMEYVQGRTLTRWAPAQPWREVLGAFLQAARGLSAAHEAGMVHRDFKPDNVLMGADGRARVADFGLAARAELEQPEAITAPLPADQSSGSMMDAKLSVDGLVMGTPFFMAPEVRYGERATAASDQFSFFRALENLMQGRPRGEGDDEVPGWVDSMVLRGLSTRAGDRWPSMAAVVKELESRLGVRPELDPRRGARARQVMLAGMMVLGLGATALTAVIGGDEVLTPKMLLALGGWQFAVTAAFIAFGARRLGQAMLGRRAMAMFALSTFAMLCNRAQAWVWHLPGAQVLAVDLLLVTLMMLVAALFVVRWTLSAAVLVGLCSAGASIWPERSAWLFIAAMAMLLAQAIYKWDPLESTCRHASLSIL